MIRLLIQVHIVPFLKKYKANPVTGETLEARNLTKLVIWNILAY
jgi:hypothetical protein